MHNFLPHPSCVAELPENEYISKQIGTCFSQGGWLWKDRGMMQTTDDRIPVLLEITSTDWGVCDAPSWLNMRSPERSHSLQYVQFMVSHSWKPVNWIGIWSFLAASEDFACSKFYLKFFFINICTVYSLSSTDFNQNTVFFILQT